MAIGGLMSALQSPTGGLGGFYNFARANPGAMAALGGGIMTGNTPGGLQAFGQYAQQGKERQLQEAQRNKTLGYLQRNRPDLAARVSAGLPIAEAWKQVNSRTKAEVPASVREYEYAKGQGYQGSYIDFEKEQRKAGASNITVGGGKYGTIPKGFQLFEEGGKARLEAIPGGPGAAAEQKIKDAKGAADAATIRSGDVVLEDIDRVLTNLDNGGLPVAGMAGGALSSIPGTEAYDTSKLIETITANVGFDRLQAMRNSSPTGGALGAINQTEMSLLQSALGNLSQSQSADQLKHNLVRLREIYNGILTKAGAYPNANQYGFNAPSAATDVDALIDQYSD